MFRRIGFHAKRIGGQLDRHFFTASMTNPPADFRLEHGDDAVVVAESLGELQPLALQQA